ncbi:MAG: hypothetical protein KDA81_22460, partial [Planctomycetaceae bacterium]|nr:hypothetical protein [Planctomycetaceae bacterium]
MSAINFYRNATPQANNRKQISHGFQAHGNRHRGLAVNRDASAEFASYLQQSWHHGTLTDGFCRELNNRPVETAERAGSERIPKNHRFHPSCRAHIPSLSPASRSDGDIVR